MSSNFLNLIVLILLFEFCSKAISVDDKETRNFLINLEIIDENGTEREALQWALQGMPCQNQMKILVRSLVRDDFYFHLELNSSEIYFKINDLNEERDCCFYHGAVVNKTDSWCAFVDCQHRFHGLVIDGAWSFFIEFNEEDQRHHLTVEHSSEKPIETGFKCGVDDNFSNEQLFYEISSKTGEDVSGINDGKMRRSLIDDNATENEEKFVELVIVNDFSTFRVNNFSKTAVTELNKQIVNLINGFYRALNINIILVGIITWNEGNAIKIIGDAEETLKLFRQYRRQVINPMYRNDLSILLTNENFHGGILGKAIIGSICTFYGSAAIISNSTGTLNGMAMTVAHEMGHNLGMDHDRRGCKCVDQQCIMHPISSDKLLRHWSSCSKTDLRKAASRYQHACLMNQPTEEIDLRKFLLNGRSSANCGNGILENGEDCDCLVTNERCNSSCCVNCTIINGLQCAHGDCCDLEQCLYASTETICRSKIGPCDLDERCDGSSNQCPADSHHANGFECLLNDDEGYCFNGECQTHRKQCRWLFGENVTPSVSDCFTSNLFGNTSGDCMYHLDNEAYLGCNESDIFCGRIHCDLGRWGDIETRIGSKNFSTVHKTWITIDEGDFRKRAQCISAVIDLGDSVVDPGLVVDGVKCGDQKICFRQRCLPLTQVECFANCEGICDHLGRCYCESCERERLRMLAIQVSVGCLAFILAGLVCFACFRKRLKRLLNFEGKKQIFMKPVYARKSLPSEDSQMPEVVESG